MGARGRGADFRADLEALSGPLKAPVDAVMQRYDEIRRSLRETIVEGTLLDHGNVLLDLDWRVQTISTSSRGANLDTTVVLMTLRYGDGKGRKSLTLQLTPASIGLLKDFVSRFGR